MHTRRLSLWKTRGACLGHITHRVYTKKNSTQR